MFSVTDPYQGGAAILTFSAYMDETGPEGGAVKITDLQVLGPYPISTPVTWPATPGVTHSCSSSALIVIGQPPH